MLSLKDLIDAKQVTVAVITPHSALISGGPSLSSLLPLIDQRGLLSNNYWVYRFDHSRLCHSWLACRIEFWGGLFWCHNNNGLLVGRDYFWWILRRRSILSGCLGR